MDKSLDLFRKDFLQGIIGEAEANDNFFESAFVEQYGKELHESGEIDNELEVSHWSQRGIKVDGYSFNPDEGVLNLFVSVFSVDVEEKSLTKTAVDQAFNRLESFFKKSFSTEYYSELEEATAIYDLAYTIYKSRKSISRIKYYLLSNKIVNDRVDTIDPYRDGGIDFSFNIWDVSRLFRMDASNQKKEDILIDFDSVWLEPIYCLPAHLNTDEYQSYLLVVPGGLLANLYGSYGARLLEQNVRTFLQARGKVNKGLRNTIINQPEKFFAYNNGLTTTAESIELELIEGGLRIKSLKNLQIVNGGQTTASIFSTMKKDRASLDNLFVQVKLTIVKSNESEELVSKISEYANTQNKVNAADFFSNHPFHIRMEEFSRRLYAPALGGGHKQTKWFYERARGQYLDAQAHKTPAERKRFQVEYPKKQLFTKTDLSKFQNVWEGIPHIVAQGAQNSFVRYATEIGNRWGKQELEYNELYFKESVAKAIIFKRTEELISQAHWYDGGYRAQTVAYTISYIKHFIDEHNKFFNFISVWDQQRISLATEDAIKVVSQKIYGELTNPPAGIANVTQWAKREGCWVSIKELGLKLPSEFVKELISKEETNSRKGDAKKVQKIDDGIQAQKMVFELSQRQIWQRVLDFASASQDYSPKELSLINIALQIPRKIPTEKQSLALVETLNRMKGDGFSAE